MLHNQQTSRFLRVVFHRRCGVLCKYLKWPLINPRPVFHSTRRVCVYVASLNDLAHTTSGTLWNLKTVAAEQNICFGRLGRTRATIEVTRSSWNGFWMTGLLNPNSSEIIYYVATFSLLHLGHGNDRRAALLVPSEKHFLGEVWGSSFSRGHGAPLS